MIWYEQYVLDQRLGEPTPVVPAKDGANDVTLLGRKAASHAANGWTITQHSETGFVATKVRGKRGLYERRFHVER
jgi:hypothetical protein